jgi:Chondroitin N-acetylgalactosaminyltransferase
VPALLPASDTGAITTIDGDNNHQMVTILVTVAGVDKVAALDRFLTNFETEVLLKFQAARLVMVVFRDVIISGNATVNAATGDQSVRKLAREKAAYFENNYPGYAPRILEKRGEFSRALGLTEALKACQDSDLVFIVDVDIRFTAGALDAVRRFTSPGCAAYFPIVFSEFQGGDGGYWRDYGFGIMAAYKADIVRAGGFNTRIHGWGKEDVDLYSKCLKIGLAITRATDPNLVHVYHQAS